MRRRNISGMKHLALFMLVLLMTLSTALAAVPSTLNLHGKLTDSSGSPISTQKNITFTIYDAYTGGNTIWRVVNQSVTPDSQGIYNVILTGINTTFPAEYYLGIMVWNDAEMAPRINLTTAPTAFRANLSDDLVCTDCADGSDLADSITLDANMDISSYNVSFNKSTLYIDSTHGYVGIGTTTPVYVLHANVSGSGNIAITGNAGTSGTVGYVIESGSRGWQIGAKGSNENGTFIIYDLTSAQRRVTIDSSGNVGIGTTGPATRLEVGANGASNEIITVKSQGSSYIQLLGDTDNEVGEVGTGYALFSQDNGAVTGILGTVQAVGQDPSGTALTDALGNSVLLANRYADGALQFGTNGAARMTIDQNGNVGIGTVSPAQTLTVVGTGNFTTDLYIAGQQACREDGTNCPVSSGGGGGWANNSVVTSTALHVNITTGNLTVINGNVGIGTTGPGALLHLNDVANNKAYQLVMGYTDDYRYTLGRNYDGGFFEIEGNQASPNSGFKFKTPTGTLLTILSTGNVGIGTTGPLGTLHINSSSAGGALRIETATGTSLLFVNGSSGNVGIGTTSPSQKLEVSDATRGITFAPTAGSSVINTTSTTANNITITSQGGSVIIRLGG